MSHRGTTRTDQSRFKEFRSLMPIVAFAGELVQTSGQIKTAHSRYGNRVMLASDAVVRWSHNMPRLHDFFRQGASRAELSRLNNFGAAAVSTAERMANGKALRRTVP